MMFHFLCICFVSMQTKRPPSESSQPKALFFFSTNNFFVWGHKSICLTSLLTGGQFWTFRRSSPLSGFMGWQVGLWKWFGGHICGLLASDLPSLCVPGECAKGQLRSSFFFFNSSMCNFTKMNNSLAPARFWEQRHRSPVLGGGTPGKFCNKKDSVSQKF